MGVSIYYHQNGSSVCFSFVVSPVFPWSGQTVDFARSWVYCSGSKSRKKGRNEHFSSSASVYKWMAKCRERTAQVRILTKSHSQSQGVWSSHVWLMLYQLGSRVERLLGLNSWVFPLILGLKMMRGLFNLRGPKGHELRPLSFPSTAADEQVRGNLRSSSLPSRAMSSV